MWIARNEDGTLILFNEHPIRAEVYNIDEETINKLPIFIRKFINNYKSKHSSNIKEYGYWYTVSISSRYENSGHINLNHNLFPELKWEDNPIKVDLLTKDDKMKVIEDVLEYVQKFGINETSKSLIYEHLFGDIVEK